MAEYNAPKGLARKAKALKKKKIDAKKKPSEDFGKATGFQDKAGAKAKTADISSEISDIASKRRAKEAEAQLLFEESDDTAVKVNNLMRDIDQDMQGGPSAPKDQGQSIMERAAKKKKRK